jgi:hypothetical protein
MINIKTIWNNHKPSSDIIIKTRIDEISQIKCYAATNNITRQILYIMSISKDIDIPTLNNYRFKGVEIYTLPNENDNNLELYIYLLDNELNDIFSLFIENILEEIKMCVNEAEALIKTLNVISKWKKLFDKINFKGLSLEQQKGLIGELLFLNYLLDDLKNKTKALNAWTSTERDFQAKDFTIGSMGIEVKFTSSKQPRIKISNEKQLDGESLNKLFLVLYTSEAVKDNGFSLNSLIDQTRNKISSEEVRSIFNAKLQLNGYFEEDKEQYGNMYSLKKTYVFDVLDQFPKIIKPQLPLGIYDTSYSIEISAVENFIVEAEQILENI